jgi:hypothetical protein
LTLQHHLVYQIRNENTIADRNKNNSSDLKNACSNFNFSNLNFASPKVSIKSETSTTSTNSTEIGEISIGSDDSSLPDIEIIEIDEPATTPKNNSNEEAAKPKVESVEMKVKSEVKPEPDQFYSDFKAEPSGILIL